MAAQFSYDVFLSYSSKDEAVVRAIALRLRADGLRVWFSNWEIRPGDPFPAKIEEGLEHSRVLVAFSPDGRRVLTGKTMVGVWDAATGKKLVALEGSRGGIAAFSPDSQRVAAGIQRGYVGVWDATTGALLTRLEGDGDFNSIAFSQDGNRVLTSTGVWNAMTGNRLVTFPTPSFGGDRYEGSAAFSPDGRRAVVGLSVPIQGCGTL